MKKDDTTREAVGGEGEAPTSAEQTQPSLEYNTIKAAREAGFVKKQPRHYGGQELHIKGHHLIRDPERAISKTAWKAEGYRVLPDQPPHASVGGGGRFPAHDVYRRDQVISDPAPSCQPRDGNLFPPVDNRENYYGTSELHDRGWTDKQIRTHLGEPDLTQVRGVIRRNFYTIDRTEAAEASEGFLADRVTRVAPGNPGLTDPDIHGEPTTGGQDE